MPSSPVFILLAFGITAGYKVCNEEHWKLAFNINPEDGHNFAYDASAWEDDSNVGTDRFAFNADYKNRSVTHEVTNFIAIVRHQHGTCEAARVWEFLTPGKTLHEYLDTHKTESLMATYDDYTYSYISPRMANKDEDPIFAVDGGLTFNWLYGGMGVRIGNKGGMPDVLNGLNLYYGLGNDFFVGRRNSNDWYWFDVGVHQGWCWAYDCKVQGSDHGEMLENGPTYGQYAIYVSDVADTFDCEDVDLEISISGSLVTSKP